MLNFWERNAVIIFRGYRLARKYAVCLALASILILVAPFMVILVQVILFLFAMLTLFTIFLNESFSRLFYDSTELINRIFAISHYTRYLAWAAVGFSVLAIFLATLHPQSLQRKPAIISSVILAALITILAVILTIIFEVVK